MNEKTESLQSDFESRANEVGAYFAGKAAHYDDVDQQPYWVFSDDLLWELLRKLVLDRLRGERTVKLLDAGAGTARWSSRILQYLVNCRATLVDISPEMLSVAEQKLRDRDFLHRADIVIGDIQDLEVFKAKVHDLVICFHNVLSFVTSPELAISNLSQATAQGGSIVLVIPNSYHAVYFSIVSGRSQELDRIKIRSAVKFADNVPEMLLFTPSRIKSLLEASGFEETHVYGFPVSIYPQIEETTLKDSNALLRSVLADEAKRKTIFELEVQMCSHEEAAARGNNLLVIGHKPR